ncbi:DUF6923 family protein [Streptomyces roseochromogenus]|nr:hypothetical protein [Streptomyces roseochromogenus]
MTMNRYNPFTYLAVGKKNTKLYTFDVFSGVVTDVGVPAYADGYDALAFRWKTGLLYAMSQKDNSLALIIDPKNKTITPKSVTGLPSQSGTWVLGAMTTDGDGYIITGSSVGDKGAELQVASEPIKAIAQNPPGGGSWYDWSYHPKDGRLYAVDGKDGALLYANPAANPQKTVLKENVFPKAEAGATGDATYSALFFDNVGWLYAIDNAGNVFKTDLRASTASKPIGKDDVRTAERVGKGKVPVKTLDIRDAAGDVQEQKKPPEYEVIPAKDKLRQPPWTEWDEQLKANRVVFSFRVTLGPAEWDVHRWRILFRQIKDAKVVCTAADTKVEEVPGWHVLDSQKDRLLPKGQTLDVDLQVKIPEKNNPDLKKLPGLQARRLG